MIAKSAIWSGRLAAFAVQLIILGVLLHRFEVMSTPVALNLFLTGFVLAGLAVGVGVLAYGLIWLHGNRGFARATFGILLGALILAWPGFYLPKFMALPVINDVTTDTVSPPKLNNAAKVRTSGANTLVYPGNDFAKLQQISYPDIKPLVMKKSRAQAFDTARMIMKKREWIILAEDRQLKGKKLGTIEAVDRTNIMGFSDDIVVRVGGVDGQVRIDVRSASRFGRHDLGRNAERIRSFLQELHARLDVGEDLEIGVKSKAVAKVRRGKKKSLRKKVRRRKYVRKRKGARRGRKRKVWRRLRKQRRYRYKPFPIY